MVRGLAEVDSRTQQITGAVSFSGIHQFVPIFVPSEVHNPEGGTRPMTALTFEVLPECFGMKVSSSPTGVTSASSIRGRRLAHRGLTANTFTLAA
jgi:hypothetical protein